MKGVKEFLKSRTLRYSAIIMVLFIIYEITNWLLTQPDDLSVIGGFFIGIITIYITFKYILLPIIQTIKNQI